ncbi:MAG: rod shape-determining protein MreC [Chloroflexota bacterium]|nr:rod shape-determining protein MreC [Chloroflexota bacterium]
MIQRNPRARRGIFLLITLFVCLVLFIISAIGLLAPIEGLAGTPLNALSGLFNRIALALTGGVSDLAEIQELRQRNADLEEALARLQPQLVEALEIQSDYERLADLIDYTERFPDQQFIAADVIGGDANNLLRSTTIIINRGARDGIAVRMPVVTGQGLVGRITRVSADAAQVLLITSSESRVSARVQVSRAEGSVIGNVDGSLTLGFVPLNAGLADNDIIITSGLGGNFPADIVIGQAINVRQTELAQEADVRSLINFDILEVVLVITSFQPVDLSVFEDNATPVPGAGN